MSEMLACWHLGVDEMKCGKNPKRYNAGKAELSNVLEFPNGLAEVSGVIRYGAKKYGDSKNYLVGAGLAPRVYIDSAMRHMVEILAALMEEDEEKLIDSESGLSHIGHLIANGLMLAETVAVKGIKKNDK